MAFRNPEGGKDRRRGPPLLELWKKCRGKEFKDEELLPRQVREEGVLVQAVADAKA